MSKTTTMGVKVPSSTEIITGTADNTGLEDVFGFQCIAPTTINSATAANITGSLAAVSLLSGQTIWGEFTQIKLTAGTIILFRAR